MKYFGEKILEEGIVVLVRTQNFPKNYHFLPLLPPTPRICRCTRLYPRVRNVVLFENFGYVPNKWSRNSLTWTTSPLQLTDVRSFCSSLKSYQPLSCNDVTKVLKLPQTIKQLSLGDFCSIWKLLCLMSYLQFATSNSLIANRWNCITLCLVKNILRCSNKKWIHERK